MMLISSSLKSLIILCAIGALSLSKNLQIEIFELSIYKIGNQNANKTHDLKTVNELTLEPDSKVGFKCRASGRPTPFVAIVYKQEVTRKDAEVNTDTTSVELTFQTIGCHHAASYTCHAGNVNRSESITTRILIKCPISEAYFEPYHKYVAVSTTKDNFLLICKETNLPYSLALFYQINSRKRLNYTENSTLITYHIPKVTCEHMGTYFCNAKWSTSSQQDSQKKTFTNSTEKGMDFSVNDCPPKLCDDIKESLNKPFKWNTTMPVTVCVAVPINTRIIAVMYHGAWVTNGTCGDKLCLWASSQSASQFQYHIMITFKRNDTKLKYGFDIKIGSGYNYRSNYINFSIQMETLSKEFWVEATYIIWPVVVFFCLIPTTLAIRIFFTREKNNAKKKLVPMTVTVQKKRHEMIRRQTTYHCSIQRQLKVQGPNFTVGNHMSQPYTKSVSHFRVHSLALKNNVGLALGDPSLRSKAMTPYPQEAEVDSYGYLILRAK